MGIFASTWEKYVDSGSRHFADVTDLKRNRILNMLFSMSFMGGIYIALIELAFAAVLLSRDPARYSGYIMPFALLTLAYPAAVAMTVWIKNFTGSFHVTFLNNVFVNLFCFGLGWFLGERSHMHLIILSQFPIIFLFYKFGSWRSIAAHIALALAGVAAIFASYRLLTPLFPLPEDLAHLPGYLCAGATFSMLTWYSIYNWKQVHLTEALLAGERDHTQALLNETIPKLEKAEAKYRHLVEDSNDLIFQLDTGLKIFSMNTSAQRMLGFLPAEMIGKSFLEFIANGGEADPDFNRNVLRAQAKDFLVSAKPLKLRTGLVHKHRADPVEVLVSLQLDRRVSDLEILGKASLVEPEISQKFLNQEKGSYTLSNNVTHAEILSQRISDRISIHFDPHDLNSLRTCFREILINAIEHGNLGVTFDEKTEALQGSDYMEFLLARQKEAKYAHRRVHVLYMINKNALVFRVTDEGDGFDHKGFLERAQSDDSFLLLEHGRGITMAQGAFDSVEFNAKGNQVTLTKRIARST